MGDFVNTYELIGDQALTDGLIDGTLTELKDDRLTSVRTRMFQYNKSLVSIDCPNVTNIGYQSFDTATALKSVRFSNATYIDTAGFAACTSLTDVDLPLLAGTNQNILRGCTSLVKVKFPNLSAAQGGILYGCTSLAIVDFGNRFGYFNNHNNLDGCTSLTALIFRASSIVSTGYSTNIQNSGITAGTCYIYVPRTLVDSYKAATNWSNYANQFRAIEDYTVDGTTMGDFDETKI